MVDYPEPRYGVTPIECILVSFVVASITYGFWRGVGWLFGG